MPNSLQLRLTSLPRRSKRSLMILADAIFVSTSVGLAITIGPGQSSFSSYWYLFPLAIALTVPALAYFGLYRAVLRFLGSQMVVAIGAGGTIVTAALVIAALALKMPAPGPVFEFAMVFWSFTLLTLGGGRFLMRAYILSDSRPGERVAIYGAGEAGARLVSALAGGNEFAPVAFIDDGLSVQGRSINGVDVYHPDVLPKLVDELGIKRVLLAMPSISRHVRQSIITMLESLPVHVQTMPDITDLVSGHARVDEIRDVDVADLLGRDPIPPDVRLLDACIRGKSVMVTGAGGSIGSELCRQIIQLRPRRLLLFEMSELALYTIDRELRHAPGREELDIEVIPLLGSVHHKYRVREVLQTFEVETVYHAAAYKHVPMVEHNMIEGIHNNIVGTWHTAEAAVETHVKTFVLVSTDKAVGPTNVMGATKRFSELVLQGLHERGTGTRFCMVRFGNVLASSGSVVPLFREQIRKGGPVTVTHPEIIRYFMTIPEAAQLVIQAGSMSKGGDVFVLDMGKPVRIQDLARRMIHLMGLSASDENNPDGDIAIEYTGLRPAEKLYEELVIGNNVMGTEHPMIMRALEESLPWDQVRYFLDQMLVAARKFDCSRARELLLESVAGYQPTNGVEDTVWRQSRDTVTTVDPGNVTELASRLVNREGS